MVTGMVTGDPGNTPLTLRKAVYVPGARSAVAVVPTLKLRVVPKEFDVGVMLSQFTDCGSETYVGVMAMPLPDVRL
jgi:hypothetical protein